MFVGHYSAGFALKKVRPQVPLWVLFLAVQLVDIGWGTLVCLGVEKARVVPGFTKAFPLDLYFMPYTHSLVAGLIWAAAAALLYRAWRKSDGFGAALVVGVAVLSHWFLDLPVHAPDLPLYGDQEKFGFGLWNHPLWAFLLEIGVLELGVHLYVSVRPERRGATYKFFAALVLIQAGQTFGPWLLPTAQAVALSALVSYFLFAYVAARIDRTA